MQQRKDKLIIEEQIRHMESKGIKFDIIKKDQARLFLSDHTYYFKIKAFSKNYDKFTNAKNKGKYINLEFAYLQELSVLDMHFRKLILSMTLDIEHALKTNLNKNVCLNENEDGYNIVNLFLKQRNDISAIYIKNYLNHHYICMILYINIKMNQLCGI